MDEGGRFRRRLVIALALAALVTFGWVWLRTSGIVGGGGCAPERQVERDAGGTVTRITTRECPQE
ncbi:hypothetical protein [Stakelama saccharophila]|uniref:Uncharacterized protein n=1 Tax=Stakelama saccharophila TaxID=3075605 RepID=A0ABZ0BBZ7_9SPHN|nr:hypothetical protein [Stakelama sp. W311]WNO54951.1 hypothetical protein RPR59_06820 [Stakelama sp. W311]